MKKKLFAVAALLLICFGAQAVFNEKDLGQTISVLRYELSQENAKLAASEKSLASRGNTQRRQMIRIMKKCNELSLILYSQNQDFTFDMTYALKEVTKQYEDFDIDKLPFDEIIAKLNIEVDRYERLIESLRRLPPVLDEIEEVPDSISISKDSLMLGFRSSRQMGAGPRPSPEMLKKMASDTTRRVTFVLDEQGQQDRDSCIFYARNILKMYKDSREKMITDSEHYDEASSRLKATYDYAQERYQLIQKRIFTKPLDNYFYVLTHFGTYAKRAIAEAKAKYGTKDFDGVHHKSEWRGPVVSGFVLIVIILLLTSIFVSSLLITFLSKKVAKMQTGEFRTMKPSVILFVGSLIFAVAIMIANASTSQNFFKLASSLLLIFAWLLTAILASMLFRLDARQMRSGVRLYTPVIILGLLVITFRIIFIPNKMINLVFPPLLVLFFIWQWGICMKELGKAHKMDVTFGWLTLFFLGIATLLSWMGYALLSILIVVWWLFQLTAIQTITALYDVLKMYEKKITAKKLAVSHARGLSVVDEGKKGGFIQVTWLYDLLNMAGLPVLGVASLPISLMLASEVFDMTEICRSFIYKPFFDLTDKSGDIILHLSLYKILVCIALFFIFRYLSYALKAFYKHIRWEKIREKSGQNLVEANQINLTLANNVIGIGLWGIYILIVIIFLRIPMGALSIVAAGLATGVGLALKDVLNNFIYGIQLMSGRVRVGDFIECEGVRGKVDSITYQSTQVETLEGSILSITNTALFNNKFKNLTKNSPYEFVKIMVGVAYGTDINKVCQVLKDALIKLNHQDKYGRWLIEQKYGINPVFGEFSDSSVDIAVKQYIIVEEQPAYIAKAKQVIYETLAANDISIPFPQRDIHVIKPQ